MILKQVIEWKRDVFPAWQRSAGGANNPNPDVWGVLPFGVCWFQGSIEKQDIQNIFLIGSDDWGEVFGTYKLTDVKLAASEEDDQYKHRSRIKKIQTSLADGWNAEPIILVAAHGEGRFVVIDGNHRAIAMADMDLLVGRDCYVGFHARMETDFEWWQKWTPELRQKFIRSSGNRKL